MKGFGSHWSRTVASLQDVLVAGHQHLRFDRYFTATLCTRVAMANWNPVTYARRRTYYCYGTLASKCQE